MPYHCEMGHRKTYWDTFLKDAVKYTTENPENNCSQEDICNFNIYREIKYSYDPLPDFNGDNVRLCGYFQSFKYFENERSNVMDILNIEGKKREVLTKYPHLFVCSGEIVSIHFRLGDYKNIRYYHPVMNYEYFENALGEIMRTRSVTRVLYICEEEDNAYVESKIRLLKSKYDLEYVKVEDTIPDYEQVLVMSCCNHNIISNSTFSWWGAYMNNFPEKIVCYPSVWFGEYFEHAFDFNDVTLSSWSKIEANPARWRDPLV
jgi:hypothetical protein